MLKPNPHFALRAGLVTAVLAALATALAPAPALAANTIYWNWATLYNNSYVSNSGISLANLGGSGGAGLTVSGVAVDHPLGVAIDAATGTMYWANFGSSINYCSGPLAGGNTISYAHLDGTGGGTLNTNGATVSGPDGVAIDPAAGRLYWANDHANTISYASLDGSGGHDLNTTGATVNCPAGLAVDPAVGRVYWTNFRGNTISYANLDGSGGGDLPISGATVSGPYGLAINSSTGRLYWANNTGESISYSNLDGSGGEDLSTTGATTRGPWGIAIDPAAGRIYWANNIGSTISYANLNESGGGDLSTPGAAVDHPKYPALLEVPSGAGPPVVGGGSTTGSRLSCSSGTWAADLPESFLYRAPQHVAYSWSRNGTPIPGSPSSITARAPGRYACQVTASNFAGSTSQTSAQFTVLASPSTAIAVTSTTVSGGDAVSLGVLVRSPGKLRGTATFTTRTTRFAGSGRHRHKVTRAKTFVYGTAGVRATGAGTVTLTIRPSGTALRLLHSGKKLELTLALAFARADGTISRASLHVSV